MTMQATVLQVRRNQLLVFDWETKQQVVVHTPLSCRFGVGGLVCTNTTAVMTAKHSPIKFQRSVLFRSPAGTLARPVPLLTFSRRP